MREIIKNICSTPKGKIVLCLVCAAPVWIIVMLTMFKKEPEVVTKTVATEAPTTTAASTGETTTTATIDEIITTLPSTEATNG